MPQFWTKEARQEMLTFGLKSILKTHHCLFVMSQKPCNVHFIPQTRKFKVQTSQTIIL